MAILGGGAAAFAAAIKANELGARTVMIDGGTIGGTCVNFGCVPSKRMLTAAEHAFYPTFQEFDGVACSGMSCSVKEIVDGKNKLVASLRKKKYRNVVESLENVTYVEGKGVFESKSKVRVGTKTYTAKKFVVATGSSPNPVQIPGISKVKFWTNVEALNTRDAPKSITIIGGRALALEFSQIFAHLGAEVTVLQRSDRILPNEEPEISEALAEYLNDEGIEIHTGVSLHAVKEAQSGKVVVARVNGRLRQFESEELLMATGRRPNTRGINLERVGVRLRDDGAVLVNREMRTAASHVWAGGDVIGEPMLETVAAKEGAVAAENALTHAHKRIDYRSVPRGVFTSPQVASVGLTEKEAEENGFKCSCRTLSMKDVPKALIINDTRGLIKMVIDAETHRILGVHILSPFAADLIHEGTLAVKYGLATEDIVDTVHVFPTLSEATKLVAQSFTRDVSNLSCCIE